MIDTAAGDTALERVWKTGTPELRAAAVDFWMGNGALPAQVAQERAGELVAVARIGGQIGGVSTARVQHIARLGVPMYYFRMFIAERHRRQQLAFDLIAESARALEADAHAAGRGPEVPRGILIEFQNPKAPHALRDLVWQVREFGFVYIGNSAAGYPERVYYFPGARLDRAPKSPRPL